MIDLGKLKQKPYLSVDTETTGLTTWGDFKRWGFYPARPFAFSFCDWDGETEYIRWQVDPFTRKVLVVEKDLVRLRLLLGDSKVTKVLHNASFDLRMLRTIGVETKGTIHDTLIMMHVFTGGSELSYALKPLCVKYMGFSDDDETELEESVQVARRKGRKLGWKVAEEGINGKKPVKADFWMADPKLCEKYAVQDAERAMMLFRLLKPEIEGNPDMLDVYLKEMKLTKVVTRMEDRGTRVFPEDLVRLRKDYTEYMAKHLKDAEAHGGKGLNFQSSKQMVKKFYTELKIPVKLGKTGNPSVDGDKLVEIAEKHKNPLARAILEYRGGAKMINGFIDPYERFRIEEKPGTWVLHPNYRQCGPVTGRFSCTEPNLMQVASETTGRRRTEITLKPREAFGPRDGYIWYMPDYSQIEVWVFAFLSQEKAMMEALLTGRDFHGAVAEKVWGGYPDYAEKKSYYRKRAKLLMFCKLYGGGVNKVAYLTDSTPDEAKRFVAEYDNELPGVKTFMRKMVSQAERDGKIINPFGRTYFIDPGFAYKAVNYMVQGTSADILKNAMIRVQDMLDARWDGVRSHHQLLLTLHDELGIEVPLKYHSKRLMREIITEMQRDSAKVGLPVPLPVDFDIVRKRWNKSVELCRGHLNDARVCPEAECVAKRKKE